MKRFLTQSCSLLIMVSALALSAGCVTGRGQWPVKMETRPAVAVEEFKNESGFDGKWSLNKGMARLLADGLRMSGDVDITGENERAGTVGDILEQGKDLLLKDGKGASSKPAKAQYVIRGILKDFTVAGDSSGWFAPSRARLGRANVELELSITDAKSGAVLSSFEVKGSASRSNRNLPVNYKEMAFGGRFYSETPLGKATDQALRKGVKKILSAIPPEYWQPRIAEAGPDTAIINGGANAKVRKHDEFIVREESRDITDPVTGRVIETVPGRRAGRIRVTQVRETSAHAQIIEGSVRRGQVLEPAGERIR